MISERKHFFMKFGSCHTYSNKNVILLGFIVIHKIIQNGDIHSFPGRDINFRQILSRLRKK